MTLAINHPGMSRIWFDQSLHRAMMADLSISATTRPGTVAVSSGTSDEVEYLVTRVSCGCAGHARTGRCYHRAYAIGFWDVFSRVELGAALYRDETA